MTLVPTVMAHGQANAEIREDGSPSLTCNHEAPILAQTLYENHPQDSRITAVDSSPTITSRAGTGGGNLPLVAEAKEPTLLEDQGGAVMKVNDSGVASTLRSESHGHEPLIFESRIARNGRGAPSDVSPPLKAQSGEDGRGDGAPLVAYTAKLDNTQSNHSGKVFEEYTPAVSKASAALLTSVSVRRLTPRECERLQGFPDDWTLVPVPQHTTRCDLYIDVENVEKLRPTEGATCTCGKPSKLIADGPRYKALGNSMAVPVMAWIGRRIQLVDDLLKAQKKVKRG
jgi:DNA (cytosine-5)-methyltransferase 1